MIGERPFFMENEDWYKPNPNPNSSRGILLTDKAPPEAVISYNKFYDISQYKYFDLPQDTPTNLHTDTPTKRKINP